MSPAARLNALLASVTVSMMFGLITVAHQAPAVSGKLSTITAAALGLLLSAGVYRFLALGVGWLLHRSLWVRRLVFGPHFLHGTWIGFFIGYAGDKRFVIEHYDQDLDGLVMRGRSYTYQQQFHGHWTSEATAIDVRRGRLIYTYELNVVSRIGPLHGVTTFLFQRSAS
jgi:hypothetical protein